jgi:hypothetical protein
MVAGGVYWWEPANENPVGCGWVTFSDDPDGNVPVYYFGPDALPTLARNPDVGKTPSNGRGTNPAYDSKGHAISYYVSVNREVTDNLTMYGNLLDAEGAAYTPGENPEGTKTVSDIVPNQFENSITIVNAYFGKDDYPTNPTPTWCTM